MGKGKALPKFNHYNLDADGEYASNLLRELRSGKMLGEVGRRLREVVDGVVETSSPGTVTITLKVAFQKESSVIIEVTDKVAAVRPEDRTDAFFVADDMLSRHEPRPADGAPGLFDVHREGATVVHITPDGLRELDDFAHHVGDTGLSLVQQRILDLEMEIEQATTADDIDGVHLAGLRSELAELSRQYNDDAPRERRDTDG